MIYLNITVTILDIIRRPVFYSKQLNSIGLSVPHMKQVNAIYKFVTMVY
jgi:hypothetical protein